MLKVSGFPELTPEQKILEEKILNIIKTSYQSLGYTPIETPAVERNSVLTAKGGNEVSKQIFGLYGLAQGCEDTKDYSLHFDLTVPFARYVIDHKNELNFPFKRSQIQKVRRGERAQKGRFREFYQADIDVIWENGEYNFYDAEIIFTLAQTLNKIFTEFNLDYSFTIKLNNKKIITGFLKGLNLETKIQTITTIIDKKDKISQEELINLLQKENLNPSQIEQIINFIKNDINKTSANHSEMEQGLEELKKLIENLENLGVKNYKIDFGIVRGLDYYTGTVFETFINEEAFIGSIASGGRYENFTKFIDPKFNFSGVGGSIGVSRLESLLFEKLKPSKKTTTEYLIINFPETKKESLQLFKKLLEENKAIEFYPEPDKLKKQFKYADKKGIKFCIILGEDELKNGFYILKNMETGEQNKISLK